MGPFHIFRRVVGGNGKTCKLNTRYGYLDNGIRGEWSVVEFARVYLY